MKRIICITAIFVAACISCLAQQITASTTENAFDLVVAKDGSGDFTTVQEAVNASPDYLHDGRFSILVKEGEYYEQITIPQNKRQLTIKGEGAEKTILYFDKAATKRWKYSEYTMGTSGSASVYVHAADVVFEDLTVRNSAGTGAEVGQAVALFTNGNRFIARRCRIIGHQDTLYTFGKYDEDGQYMKATFEDCYIEGGTDFIFGSSTVWFENCEIHSLINSYITAASTLQGQKYGYVFHNCRLTAETGVDKVYLGRPWRPYAKTLFIECELGGHIRPEGWHNWDKESNEKTARYGEYGNTGPGAGTEGRVRWAKQLTKKERAACTYENVILN